MSASTKRHDGIKTVNNAVVTVEYVAGNPINRWHMSNATEIGALIRSTLAPLGRTERWQNAVEEWATAVENNGNMEWAFFQYGIYAAYAAE